MAKKAYVVLKLKDEFSRPLKKAEKGTKEFDKTVELANKRIKKFSKAAMQDLTTFGTKTAKVLAGTATALAGVVLAKGWSRMTQIDNAKVKLEAIGNSAESVQKIMDNALASVKGTAYGMDADEKFETEGRVITLEFPDYYFVTVYTPNAQRELTRLDFRCEWEDAFRAYLIGLDKKKPVIVCGDMNVAHNEIDLKNPKSNRGNAGFTDEERQKFTVLLESGFADSFRMLYPDRADAYTWWSYMFKARERNTGWRIDYFLVSARLIPSVKDAFIRSDVMGSDHCPVGLLLETQRQD